MPYHAARDALRGQATPHVAKGRVILRYRPDGLLQRIRRAVARPAARGRAHLAARVIGRDPPRRGHHQAGTGRARPEGEVDRPKAAFARSPVILVIDGTLPGHERVEFAEDEIARVPAELMLSPLEAPRPLPVQPPREIVPSIVLPPGVYH